MKPQKVIFIDTAHPSLKDGLEKLGFRCDSFGNYGREQFKSIIKNYQGIIIRSKLKLDADFLQHGVKLKFIARVGAGMENIDLVTAERMGISCIHAPEGNRDAVAEQALAMLLMLFNNLKRADAEVRSGKWIREANRGLELGGKTVGIIGYGNTGSAFARKLSGFGVKVLAYDKYKNGYADAYVSEAKMKTIQEESDIISLHIPLSEETTYLVDAAFIEQFHKAIYLINTSRGKVVRTIDLVSALKSKKIKGACLDVLEYEGLSFEALQADTMPLEFQELVQMEEVILSPHIAGWTQESNIKMAQVIVDKVAQLLIKK